MYEQQVAAADYGILLGRGRASLDDSLHSAKLQHPQEPLWKARTRKANGRLPALLTAIVTIGCSHGGAETAVAKSSPSQTSPVVVLDDSAVFKFFDDALEACMVKLRPTEYGSVTYERCVPGWWPRESKPARTPDVWAVWFNEEYNACLKKRLLTDTIVLSDEVETKKCNPPQYITRIVGNFHPLRRDSTLARRLALSRSSTQPEALEQSLPPYAEIRDGCILLPHTEEVAHDVENFRLEMGDPARPDELAALATVAGHAQGHREYWWVDNETFMSIEYARDERSRAVLKLCGFKWSGHGTD